MLFISKRNFVTFPKVTPLITIIFCNFHIFQINGLKENTLFFLIFWVVFFLIFIFWVGFGGLIVWNVEFWNSQGLPIVWGLGLRFCSSNRWTLPPTLGRWREPKGGSGGNSWTLGLFVVSKNHQQGGRCGSVVFSALIASELGSVGFFHIPEPRLRLSKVWSGRVAIPRTPQMKGFQWWQDGTGLPWGGSV